MQTGKSSPPCSNSPSPPVSLLLPDPTTKAQIRELLRSHSPPPAHFTSTISPLSEELARYDDEVAHCENEIVRLRAQLVKAKADRAALKAHRAALKAHHDDVSSLVSPMRRLPSEFLVSIFTLSAESLRPTNSVSNAMARLAREPLLTVSQVCIRWHRIALGTPTLWNTIDL